MKDFIDLFSVERLFGTIFEINIFNSIAEKLSENLFSSSGKFSPMLGAVQACYNMVYPIAVMLIFIYFIVTMIDKVASDTFTPEQAWKTFALLLGTKVLIEHGFELIQLLFNIGLSISAQFAKWSGLFSANRKPFLNGLGKRSRQNSLMKPPTLLRL